jgi:fatty-acyl-CoA synthase
VRPGDRRRAAYNCPEYVQAMLGAFRARAVPFNVNQHYRPEEVARLLE